MNNMLTLEEVRGYLDADQQELERFLKQGKLHAYKIGGTYIRFRKEEVLNLRYELLPKKRKGFAQGSFLTKVSDFWRFNNFYIISLAIVATLAILMFRS